MRALELIRTYARKVRVGEQIVPKEEINEANLKDISFAWFDFKNITSVEPVEDMGALESLRIIDLKFCALKQIPSFVFESQATFLNLKNNYLTHISDDIGKLSGLQYLNASYNNIMSVSSCLPHTLEYLSLSRNNLQELDTELVHLHKLQILQLSYNRLELFPSSIAILTKLHKLNVSNNKLTQLADIKALQELKILYANHNTLREVDESIYELKKLVHLYLGCNELTKIDEKIARLTKLQNLDVSSNLIETLPAEISELRLNVFNA